MDLVDVHGCDLVLTTGGTGPAPRDVTPEATLAVGDREMPGFGEQMRQVSLKFVPTAILSRQVAVIRRQSLIINLPGQPKAIRETLEGARGADGAVLVNGVFAAVPYCIDLIGGPYIETDDAVVKAFRPKNAHPTQGRAVTAAPSLEALEIETGDAPRSSVIWLHGLGADGHDFEPIVGELDLPADPVRFVFPHAPMQPVTINGGMVMRAWYDIVSSDLARREDAGGVRASQALLEALIARERARGTPARPHRARRVLAGRRHRAADRAAPRRAPRRHHGALDLRAASPTRSRPRPARPTRDVPIFYGARHARIR